MSAPAWVATSLRRRLVIAFTGLVAMAVALVGGIGYFAAVDTYNDELDRALVSAATTIADGGTVTTSSPDTLGGRAPDDADSSGPIISAAQNLSADGAVTPAAGSIELPVTQESLQLAASGAAGATRYDEVGLGGSVYRVYTVAGGPGRGALQVARNLARADAVLTRIAVVTLLAGLGVIVLAVVAGWWLARHISRRLAALSAAAEKVARTGDLSIPIEAVGHDEVGSLGASLRTMLTRLRDSQDAQQELVQNAGHELRTPITSLRTNARVLRRLDELPVAERRDLLDDVDIELKELTGLVNELIELATATREPEVQQPVQLSAMIERIADRTRRRTGRTVNTAPVHTGTDTSPGSDTVIAAPNALERAITNLVENAAKFDRGEHPILVTASLDPAAGHTIEVADRGPGVPPDELDRIFDRFHRTDTARSLPGSGLGLAIVREIVEQHHGTVRARNRAGGGLTVSITLPARSPAG